MPEIASLPEPLYTAIGRLTVAAARLEWFVASCLVVIGQAPDSNAALRNPVSRNIDTLRDWLDYEQRVDDRSKVMVTRWLEESKSALSERNKIVHSVVVVDLDDAATPKLYHPRSDQMHLPTPTSVDAITEELHRCAAVGNQRSVMLARLVGYSLGDPDE